MKHHIQTDENLARRLTSYAASAGTFITLGLSSQAQVDYSGEQVLTLNFPDDSIAIDLDGDLVNDFAFQMLSYNYSNASGSSFSNNDSGWALMVNLNNGTYKNSWITELSTILISSYGTSAEEYILPVVAALEFGDVVDNGELNWGNATYPQFYGVLGGSAVYSYKNAYSSFSNAIQAGNFKGEEKYIGVRFYIGNEQHYGWIRVHLGEETEPVTIVDWAYEQTPDKTLQAGQGLGLDLPPSFIFSRTGTATNPNSTITLTATETITGFTSNDITATNGTITNFTVDTPGEVFTMDVEAQEEGQILVEIAQGTFSDLAANENNLIVYSWPYDITGPIPVFEITDSVVSWSGETVFLYFAEPVEALDTSDFILTNCYIEEFSNWQQPQGTTYFLWVNASSEGTVSIQLPAGATRDEAGNPSLAASASWIYDTSVPQIYFSEVSAEVTEATQTISITFSEEIQDFDITNLEVFNGAVSNLVEIIPGIEYQLDITADDFGSVTVVLPEYTVFDSAGNPTPGDGISWNYVEPNSVDSQIAEEISIFPNPANNRLTIHLPEEGAIKIMDLQGKTVLSKEEVLQETFEIDNLKAGIYIVQVRLKGITSTYRLAIE